VTSAQNLALLARFREDVRRSRQALETLAAQGEQLERLLESPDAPMPGTIRVDPGAYERPAEALARAMIRYLEQGGRLEPDVAIELSQALTASRARRRTDEPPPIA
jgi:hypothetical protein